MSMTLFTCNEIAIYFNDLIILVSKGKEKTKPVSALCSKNTVFQNTKQCFTTEGSTAHVTK